MAAPKGIDEFTPEDWTLLADLAKEETQFVEETGRSKSHLNGMATALRKQARAVKEQMAHAESKPDDDDNGDDDAPETPVTPEKDDSGEPQEPATPSTPDVRGEPAAA
jgi:hypothetical protein